MPFFKLHHNYFNTEAETDAEIFCLFRSSPPAKSVKWFRGNKLIRDGDKYTVSADEKDHHDRTILLIKNIEKSDLTSYFCEVQVGLKILKKLRVINFLINQNDLGTKRENVTLGLVPTIPKYDGFKYINNILYTDWLVKSHQELKSIQILFRNNEVSQAEREHR